MLINKDNIAKSNVISLQADLLKETGCLNNSEYLSIQIDIKELLKLKSIKQK